MFQQYTLTFKQIKLKKTILWSVMIDKNESCLIHHQSMLHNTTANFISRFSMLNMGWAFLRLTLDIQKLVVSKYLL